MGSSRYEALSPPIGAVMNDTPVRPVLPCVVESDEPDATPAAVTPLAG